MTAPKTREYGIIHDDPSDRIPGTPACRLNRDRQPTRAIGLVSGLRVCDASIMPSDCRANLHFTCAMIGENLARRMSKSDF